MLDAKQCKELVPQLDISDRLTASLSIANLLDEGPAFMANNGSQANTDTEMYDVFGRAYTLRLLFNY